MQTSPPSIHFGGQFDIDQDQKPFVHNNDADADAHGEEDEDAHGEADDITTSTPLKIKIRVPLPQLPTMAATNIPIAVRRSSRHRTSSAAGSDIKGDASGSEYQQSDRSMEANPPPVAPDDEEEEEPEVYIRTRGGRTVKKKTYIESEDDDGIPRDDMDDGPAELDVEEKDDKSAGRRTRTSTRRGYINSVSDDDDEEEPPVRRLRSRNNNPRLNGFIASDDDDHKMDDDDDEGYGTRRTRSRAAAKKQPVPAQASQKQSRRGAANGTSKKRTTITGIRSSRRTTRLSRRSGSQEDDYVQQSSSTPDADADGSLDSDADVNPSSDLDVIVEQQQREREEAEAEEAAAATAAEPEDDGRPYALRQRQKINYAIPPPLEEMPRPPPGGAGGGHGGRGNANGRNAGGGRYGGGGGGGARGGAKGKGLGWSASGAELGRWMGMGGDDSDSDYPTRTPRKPFGGVGAFGAAGAAAGGVGGMIPGDLAAGGTPSNFGKIGDAALADADPLGVNVNVTFDEVGGLDEHIHSLKEMTLLPLLYPELFQQYNVTPPRGVLFHGPPGTGKTLMARALAASCRSGGRQISFFMRKGADCLSKWVGEAERQLRLLFEEARAQQPSIIFFDEIDGLAPVRSSKQDQIHASIVSTLLALMDGMDGRGQVVVIGATNRPDAIDPALRRPGRFDREFYFPLPGLDARERILGIMTKGWRGWELDGEAEQAEKGKERLNGLAKLTKGYGGADLRALCTEATLNAIQRRYPQIYKSNDRLLVKPETISVQLRDFMISIKKLVPSSARSSTSAAAPLPKQFVPLLGDSLEKVKEVINRVMPMEKKLTALEEAEFEDVGGDEGALEKEMLSQAMQTLRIYRPRMILHGAVGMGQVFVGAAALHHLEGYHVQSLELGSLLSDSTRTVEAGIVQLFVEAKRHQPSIIYIPSLIGWCAAVSETSRSTVRAMLDTLSPTDPILLLAVVDGHFSQLPKDVKAWFGPTRDNRVEFRHPSSHQREEFFEGLIKDVCRPPNQFADGVKRRKRILEELPIAPPLEPRQPTAAELAVQEENDQRIITLLKYRLGPILTELKRKFKRFTKRATEEYNFDPAYYASNGEPVTTSVTMEQAPNGATAIDGEQPTQPAVNGHPNGVLDQQVMEQMPKMFDMDLERMHTELYKGRYLTPQDFLDDVGKIVHNADVHYQLDPDRFHKAQAMFTAAQVSIQEFDPQLRTECERMAARERQRREAHRKSKEKEKSAVVGARRSARNIGQEPELSITDPNKLMRRMKRSRGEGENSTDSHGSDIDAGTAEGRDLKRSRMDTSEDERDPLDIVGGTPPSQVAPRQQNVRFAQVSIEPMQSLAEMPGPSNYLAPPEHPSAQQPASPSDQMMVDSSSNTPSRSTATSFNFLLNPMSPSQDVFSASSVHPTPNGIHSQPPPAYSYDSPFSSTTPAAPLLHVPSPPHLPVQQIKTPEPERLPTPPPMVIEPERSPTPVLPDFHVDERLVDKLRYRLRDDTVSLTIEQLEQLRATCLGNVWRHRTEWNRDALVGELLDVVKDFVEEVNDFAADWNSSHESF